MAYRPHAYRPPADWPGALCLDCGKPAKDFKGEDYGEHFKPAPEGWEPIETAPKWSGEQEYLLPDGTSVIGHWAQDLSGEHQPPFRGFFTKKGRDYYGDVMVEIYPVAWREQSASQTSSPNSPK